MDRVDVRATVQRDRTAHPNTIFAPNVSQGVTHVAAGALAVSSETFQSQNKDSRFLQHANNVSAEFAGFVSRVLIERCFFQNTTIPADLLLHTTNDLIQILTPPKRETFSLAKEGVIIWKWLRGQPLTSEEEAYDSTPKQLDVVGEIFRGLKYSSIALMGQRLYSSVTTSLSQGLQGHLPWIVGSSAAVFIGPQCLASAIERIFQKSKLTEKQKILMRPWLNMIGRLAIGFIPKVHATENGVHYHYPSLQGSTQTFSQEKTVSLQGDELSIEQSGYLETPEGRLTSVYKLKAINTTTEESIEAHVVDPTGKVIPIEFVRIQGPYGPQIRVKSENQQLQAHWSRYFNISQPSTGRSLSDVACVLPRRAFHTIQRSFFLFDKFLSKIVAFPPQVGADPVADRVVVKEQPGDGSEITQIQNQVSDKVTLSITFNDLMQYAVNPANYRWEHYLDFDQPSKGYSIKIIKMGVPKITEIDIGQFSFQATLVHQFPKQYFHKRVESNEWSHEDPQQPLSYPMGKIVLIDDDPGQNNLEVPIQSFKIMTSCVKHVPKQTVHQIGNVIWKEEHGCLKPYHKLAIWNSMQRPDKTIYPVGNAFDEREYLIDSVTHLQLDSITHSKHSLQVLKLAINHPLGNIVVDENYTMKSRKYVHRIEFLEPENDDSSRTCIRAKEIYITHEDGCHFFGTDKERLVVKVEKTIAYYMYRGERDQRAWYDIRPKSWYLKYAYSRCKNEPGRFDDKEELYDSQLNNPSPTQEGPHSSQKEEL